MRRKYSLKDIDNIDNLPEDEVIVLDDRGYRYDEVNDRLVRPGEAGYEELPELIL